MTLSAKCFKLISWDKCLKSKIFCVHDSGVGVFLNPRRPGGVVVVVVAVIMMVDYHSNRIFSIRTACYTWTSHYKNHIYNSYTQMFHKLTIEGDSGLHMGSCIHRHKLMREGKAGDYSWFMLEELMHDHSSNRPSRMLSNEKGTNLKPWPE